MLNNENNIYEVLKIIPAGANRIVYIHDDEKPFPEFIGYDCSFIPENVSIIHIFIKEFWYQVSGKPCEWEQAKVNMHYRNIDLLFAWIRCLLRNNKNVVLHFSNYIVKNTFMNIHYKYLEQFDRYKNFRYYTTPYIRFCYSKGPYIHLEYKIPGHARIPAFKQFLVINDGKDSYYRYS